MADPTSDSPRSTDPSGAAPEPAITNWGSFELLQSVIDHLPDPVFIKDLQHRWIGGNHAFCKLLGRPLESILGFSDPDYFPPEQVKQFWDGDDHIFTTGSFTEFEEAVTHADGSVHTIWTRKFPLRDAQGRTLGLVGIISDVSNIKTRLALVSRLEAQTTEQQSIIRAQETLLDEMAVPVIQIWEGVLLLPLVGAISNRRAQQVLESLLNSISRARARFVLIDITGVPVVDTAVANYLITAVQSARLLGTQSIMVGIGSEIARTLVSLGIDFSWINTRSTLQSGLEYALRQLSYSVERVGDRAGQDGSLAGLSLSPRVRRPR